jgi:hypothetical protein
MKKLLLFLFLIVFLTAPDSFAQRKTYSGSRHTTSHGGSYSGGRGSSHKGGHYKNSSTGNRYGRHKS